MMMRLAMLKDRFVSWCFQRILRLDAVLKDYLKIQNPFMLLVSAILAVWIWWWVKTHSEAR